MQNPYAYNPINPERLVIVIGLTTWARWLADRHLPVVDSDRMGALADLRSFPVIAPEEVLDPPAGAPPWRADGSPKKRRFRGRWFRDGKASKT